MKNHQTSVLNTILLWTFLLIPFLWAAELFAQVWQPGQDIMTLSDRFNTINSNPFHLTWTAQTPRFMAIFAISYVIGIGVYYSTRKKKRPGEEQGSAVWGNPYQICRKYQGRKKEPEILLTQNVRMGMNTRRHQRNLNTLVVGGSGSGKTRFFAKDNLMQCNCSFIITDPKGELLRSTGQLLREQGYEVKVVDLIKKTHSFGYNPFVYIRSDTDIMKLVTNLIRNTTPKNSVSNEPFWEKSEIALLQALMLYLWHEAPAHEQNFPMVIEMLQYAEVKEEDEDHESPLDILFRIKEQENPAHIAVKYYNIYKMAAGKTAKSILISVGVRLGAFLQPEIARIMSHDELDIGSMGKQKTALFCLIPENDSSFNFIVGMLYTQAFQELYYLADYTYNGRLPVHVRCIMDEFANVVLPDDFEKILATCRSREISINIIIQNMAQIKALFEKSWPSIAGNCDTLLYLGGNEQETHEYISKMLGKATIDTNTYGKSKGRSGSFSTNFQQHGRELLMPDEVRMLDNRDALLFIRGERPIMDRKYDLMRHPNIKSTMDGGQPPFLYNEQMDRTIQPTRYRAYRGADPVADFEFIDGDQSDESDEASEY